MNFDVEYPIRKPAQLRVSFKPFVHPSQKKDDWIYQKVPLSNLYLFSGEMPENMIIHLAGLLTPFFGWKTVRIQANDFPDAIYQDIATGTNIRVEFEKRSSDFIIHDHPASECDIILCWEDDLTDSEKQHILAKNPNIRIVELKKIFFHYDIEVIPVE